MKCFIIAMDKEAKPILDLLDAERSFTVCGKKIYIGRLFGERVGVAVSGVGKVNAAMTAQIAVDELGAEVIINLGVAGGLCEQTRIGCFYEVSCAVQYDFDLTVLNGTSLGTLDECKENYLPLRTAGLYPARKIATGDRFNDSKEDFITLTRTLGAHLRDMECGAVAQVCMHANVPCYAFKAVSDVAGGDPSHTQYAENMKLCQKAISDEIENIVKGVK